MALTMWPCTFSCDLLNWLLHWEEVLLGEGVFQVVAGMSSFFLLRLSLVLL